MKILFTGFDPFGGEKINPAYEAVKLLPDIIAGAAVVRVELPTVFHVGAAKMKTAIEEHKPDFVICVGQAGGRAQITPEFVGINYIDARIADNSGLQPIGEAIIKNGCNAYFTKLPAKEIVEELCSAGIPACVSYTAGTYVCNEVMYSLLHYIDIEQPNIVGGFIHVPYAAQQVAKINTAAPSMSLEMISDGLKIAAEVTIKSTLNC